MNRREFIRKSGAALLIPAAWPGRAFGIDPGHAPRITWHRHEPSRLFDRVAIDDQPLIESEQGIGVFDGFCRLIEGDALGPEVLLGREGSGRECGPARLTLVHQLHGSNGGSTEDILEATLAIENRSERACEVFAGFLTGVRPCAKAADQNIYVPVSAAGLGDPAGDRGSRLKDCHQTIGLDGFLAHYLEVRSSDPRHSTTRAPLLAPVVDIFSDTGPCRVALFGTSTEPAFFQALEGKSAQAWRTGRRLRLGSGETQVLKAFLFLHMGDATEAWKAFHQFGHHEDFTVPTWPREVPVHYFDFLSPSESGGHRGGGYDLDLEHFGEFHVGMATQHGYYLSYGDFVHPDRKEWLAMPNDPAGPVKMTLEKIKARVDASRKAGVHPAIYMHFTILDEGSPLFASMKDSVQVDAAGNPTRFGWRGPDVIKQTWKMSTASPRWRAHLVQQAQWIMELFDPDAIVLDETFTSSGWDYHRDHGGPLSQGGMELMRKLRGAVRAFGPEKALFASDCSMGNFCLWGDGEAGDHCYDRLLGHELYRKPPIRYMAALGDKAWLPCAWLYKSLWSAQVDLARKVGAAVGVTNGWGDGFGLVRLPVAVKDQMLHDIQSLRRH
ncbi:MAG: hypothetical protein M1608_08930 [Candidatus Omnitrophica bacterium]|nr:hypothetical protein [Candidatus Omnitrophota bacterium]